jgi:hypothetical protein
VVIEHATELFDSVGFQGFCFDVPRLVDLLHDPYVLLPGMVFAMSSCNAVG